MLTGAPPFANRQKPEVAFHVVLEGKRPPRPNNSEILGITDEIWNLLELCWAKDASSRPEVSRVLACLKGIAKHWKADATAFLLASDAGLQEVMSMEPEKAQKIADDIDKVRSHVSCQHSWCFNPISEALDRVGISKNTRKYLRCLQKLCGISGVLPQSFTLTGELEMIDKEPFNGGGFAYVYKAIYEGQTVVVKVLKTDTPGDPKPTRTVCNPFFPLARSPSLDETEPCEGSSGLEVASS